VSALPNDDLVAVQPLPGSLDWNAHLVATKYSLHQVYMEGITRPNRSLYTLLYLGRRVLNLDHDGNHQWYLHAGHYLADVPDHDWQEVVAKLGLSVLVLSLVSQVFRYPCLLPDDHRSLASSTSECKGPVSTSHSRSHLSISFFNRWTSVFTPVWLRIRPNFVFLKNVFVKDRRTKSLIGLQHCSYAPDLLILDVFSQP
jgi:hypothetical protein